MKKEIEDFYLFLKNNELILTKLRNKIIKIKNDLLDEKVINDCVISIAKENGFSFTYDDLKNYEKEMQNENKLSDKQLLKVIGGTLPKKFITGSLFSLLIFNLAPSVIQSKSYDRNAYYGTFATIGTTGIKNQISLNSYLTKAEISKAQEDAYEITNKLFLKTLSNVAKFDEISSYRYNKNSSKTDLESQMDLAVKNGDLPIKEFTLNQINSESALKKSEKNDLKPQFKIVKGVDALKLSESAEDCSIVQVASQFNALESVSSKPTEVKSWIYDNTQGPRASLQAVAAAKHRESAHLQNKLPDAIQGILEKSKLKDGTQILKKYPNLYKNGYLKLLEIKSVEDLKTFKDFLDLNIGEFKFLSQWVKCEGTGKKQLQVFSAAPSFQGAYIDWSKADARTNLLKEICKVIVINEYKSIAQIASLRSKQVDEPVSLHLTLVGQGVFNNPPEMIQELVETIKKELENTNVKVYLHGWSKEDCKKWGKVI